MYKQNAHNMSYVIINDQHKFLAWDPTKHKATMVPTPAVGVLSFTIAQ